MRRFVAMSRQPTESVGMCDSTTESGYSFVTQNVSGVRSMLSTGSHNPIEHSDSNEMIKRELDNATTNVSLPKAINDDCTSTTHPEKGPDSTFPVELYSRPMSQPPPPFATSDDHLSKNHVQTYGHAAPHPTSPQLIAIEKLNPIMGKPVTILGHRTLFQLGLRLDPEMLPSQNWKMMAEYMEFNNWEIKRFESERSPTMAVIQAWARMGTHTIGELISILNVDMDRPDVITDIPDFMLKDAERHERSLRKYSSQDSDPVHSLSSMGSPPLGHMGSQSLQFYPSYSYPSHSLPYSSSSPSMYQPSAFTQSHQTYTEKPDVRNSSRPVQVDIVQPSETAVMYDAFVLCNIADKEFVTERFLPKVEGEAKLRLCFPDRDITPGRLAFMDAMSYMFKRSRKLVVILSDEFFSSKEHEWQSNLAISQDPDVKEESSLNFASYCITSIPAVK